MVPPIRIEILALCHEASDNEAPTLREAVEWFKHSNATYANMPDMPLTGLEIERIESTWKNLVQKISEREGVPSGPVNDLIVRLVMLEDNLKRTVAEEAAAAMLWADDGGG